MATDVSLLRTRAVAQQLSDRLALDEAPEDLQKAIVAQPTTSSVLQLDIVGSGPDDAVERARMLAETYLAFREEQLLSQTGAVIQGYHQRIEALQAQVDDITRQYDLITAQGQDSEQAADLLTRRAQLLSQISTLEDSVENASLEVSAVVAASRVLDPASLVPQSSLRRAALALGSGLIGGLGIGLGLVVVYAVTTGRLRRRADVAAAIGLPVRFSAGRVVPKWGRWGPRDAASLDLLVDGLETALPTGRRRPIRLGLLSVDCDREGARVMAGLAHRLSAEKSVAALDLGESGLLAEEMARLRSDPVAEEGQPATRALRTWHGCGRRGGADVRDLRDRSWSGPREGLCPHDRDPGGRWPFHAGGASNGSPGHPGGWDRRGFRHARRDRLLRRQLRGCRRGLGHLGQGASVPMTILSLGSRRTTSASADPPLDWRVLAAWSALFLNVLAFSGVATLAAHPRPSGPADHAGGAPASVVLALWANPRGLMRPNAYVVLLSVLCLLALMVSLHNSFLLGSTYRALRFAGFVAVLWLLSPHWGRRDLVLLRCHRICLSVVLASVVVGGLVAPGLAFSFEGRLAGVIWPVFPTQVAHYASVLLGTTVVLWMCRVIGGRNAAFTVGVTAARACRHSHTYRSARGRCRARVRHRQPPARPLAGAPDLAARRPARRGRSRGVRLRADVLAVARAEHGRGCRADRPDQRLVGRPGASRGRWTRRSSGRGCPTCPSTGWPIDSNWIGTYLDLGLVGVGIEVLILVGLLLVTALTRPSGPGRAVAIFLVVYCIFSSITETGMSGPSAYLLDLAVASASLVRPPGGGRP